MLAETLLPFEICAKNQTHISTIYKINVGALSKAARIGESLTQVRDDIVRNVYKEIVSHGFSNSFEEFDFVSPLLPTHIGLSDFELYYGISTQQAFMKPLAKYVSLLMGLDISHDDLVDNVFVPIFDTYDLDMLLPRMNTCAVYPGSTDIAMYFTWGDGTPAEFHRLIAATGNSISEHDSLLHHLYPHDPMHVAITNKPLGFGFTYSGDKISSLKYYLLYDKMDAITIGRLENMLGYTMRDVMEAHAIHYSPYLIGLNFINNEISTSKIYFRCAEAIP